MKKTLTVMALLVAGCHVPPPTTRIGKLIRCSGEVASSRWPSAIGPVNRCLSDSDDSRSCLLGLIEPAIGMTESLIACVVRSQGTVYSQYADNNPSDKRSEIAAANASAFLKPYTFED